MNTSPTQVEEKLQDKQIALRDSIEKGEPKIFGVSERRVGFSNLKGLRAGSLRELFWHNFTC